LILCRDKAHGGRRLLPKHRSRNCANNPGGHRAAGPVKVRSVK
jgi:hypothetical protein